MLQCHGDNVDENNSRHAQIKVLVDDAFVDEAPRARVVDVVRLLPGSWLYKRADTVERKIWQEKKTGSLGENCGYR